MFVQSENNGLREHLEKLYSFCVIAKVGSLSQACRQLDSSQAALSHSLRVLEEALNVELFHRTPRGVSLTMPGKVLYEFSKKFLLEMDSIEEKLKNPEEAFSGKLKIGTQAILSAHFWPAAHQNLLKNYPDLAVQLSCGKVEDLLQSLISREIHAMVTVEPLAQEGLKVIPLYETEFKLYASTELGKRKLSIEEAKQMKIFADSVAHRDYFTPALRLFSSAGIHPDQSFQVNNLQTVIQMVTHGLGLGFLPEDSVRALVKDKVLMPVEIATLPKSFGTMKISLTTHQDTDDKLLEAFSQTIEKHVKEAEELNRLLIS